MSSSLTAAAERVMSLAGRQGLTVITAESCTSGLLAATLSEAPGAAQLLHGGFVTYTNQHKTVALGVPAELLQELGAVHPEVAVAITGVAGPSKDEDGNPVGLVCIAVAWNSFPATSLELCYGDIGREQVQQRAIGDALVAMERVLTEH